MAEIPDTISNPEPREPLQVEPLGHVAAWAILKARADLYFQQNSGLQVEPLQVEPLQVEPLQVEPLQVGPLQAELLAIEMMDRRRAAELLLRRGYTRVSIANYLNVSQATISRWSRPMGITGKRGRPRRAHNPETVPEAPISPGARLIGMPTFLTLLTLDQVRQVRSQKPHWKGQEFADALAAAYGVRYSNNYANALLGTLAREKLSHEGAQWARRPAFLTPDGIRRVRLQRPQWTGQEFADALFTAFGVRYSRSYANTFLAELDGKKFVRKKAAREGAAA